MYVINNNYYKWGVSLIVGHKHCASSAKTIQRRNVRLYLFQLRFESFLSLLLLDVVDGKGQTLILHVEALPVRLRKEQVFISEM